jgi:AraC-like DNA-binding protein
MPKSSVLPDERGLDAADNHTVPMLLVASLLEVVGRWRVTPSELLEGSGLIEAERRDPLARVSLATLSRLIERARLLTKEPGLGYYMALDQRISIYGLLGFAASSAGSLREALEIGLRFGPVFSTALSLYTTEEDGLATLWLDENADLGPARDVILINVLFGLELIARTLSGRAPEAAAIVAIDFAFAEPEYQSRFRELVPQARFDQAANRIVFDASVMDRPIVTVDRTALELALSLCQKAAEGLDRGTGLEGRVRRALWSETGDLRPLPQVAERMGTGRTLRRRLADQGIGFSELVEQERREKAFALLHTQLSVAAIAERLGYSTSAAFVRAFHRWTGTTPMAHRRRQ